MTALCSPFGSSCLLPLPCGGAAFSFFWWCCFLLLLWGWARGGAARLPFNNSPPPSGVVMLCRSSPFWKTLHSPSSVGWCFYLPSFFGWCCPPPFGWSFFTRCVCSLFIVHSRGKFMRHLLGEVQVIQDERHHVKSLRVLWVWREVQTVQHESASARFGDQLKPRMQGVETSLSRVCQIRAGVQPRTVRWIDTWVHRSGHSTTCFACRSSPPTPIVAAVAVSCCD